MSSISTLVTRNLDGVFGENDPARRQAARSAYFGRDARDEDQVGYIDANTRAIFGRSYAGSPIRWSGNLPRTRRLRRPIRCS